MVTELQVFSKDVGAVVVVWEEKTAVFITKLEKVNVAVHVGAVLWGI